MTPAERHKMLVAEIEDLTAILDDEGLMSVGVRGQPVPHPALRERRSALSELRHLERAMAGAAEPAPDDLDAFLAQ